jgi:hypothetical protein
MSKVTYENLIEDVRKSAKAIEFESYDMTFSRYEKGGGQYGEWEFRKRFGSFSSFVKDVFGSECLKDLGAIRGTQERNKYVSRLEKELGTELHRLDKFKQSVIDALKEQPIQVSTRKKVYIPKPEKVERFVTGHLSDNHFGCTIDPREVEGNAFNWEIAARRLGKFAVELANYKLDHRKECGGLNLNIDGDQIQGLIHAEDHNIDPITWQVLGTARYLIALLDYELDYYPQINVFVSPGNHDRMITTVKGRERARSQKYDSFLTIIMEIVREAFRKEERLYFHQPLTPYTTYKVFDHNVLILHGDTVFNTGNPAKVVPIEAISTQIDKFNACRNDAEKAQIVYVGHVHFGLYALLSNGVHLFINPPMNGADTFAQSIGQLQTPIAQWIVESTRQYPVGDMRLSSLKEADNDPTYNRVIPAFQYKLEL